MKTNFGERMAKERREELEKLQDRVREAKRVLEECHVWSLPIDGTLTGMDYAVRTMTSLGYDAELRYDEVQKKLRLVAVRRTFA
jgi:hypothetical protein